MVIDPLGLAKLFQPGGCRRLESQSISPAEQLQLRGSQTPDDRSVPCRESRQKDLVKRTLCISFFVELIFQGDIEAKYDT